MSHALINLNKSDNKILPIAKDVHIKNQKLLCSNCGTTLGGKFCHQCGQSNRSMIKFFGEVIKELLDDIVGYDSRLKHSIIPLFFRPGKLTNEYIKGRRFYYVMPFRLYLFTSLFFILTLQLNIDPSEMVFSSNNDNDENVGALRQPTNPLPSSVLDSQTQSLKVDSETNSDGNYGVLWDEKNSKFISLNLGDGLMNDAVDEINSKIEGWRINPKPLIDELFQLLPYMMFILLPIFAVFLKIFYIFSSRFYVEHLVFLIHNHSFLYAAILVNLSLAFLEKKVGESQYWFSQTIISVSEIFSVLLTIWMLLYVVIATKNVYQQSWGLTIVKVLILGLVYSIILTIALVVTIAIGAYFA
jgi:hypothetical protein